MLAISVNDIFLIFSTDDFTDIIKTNNYPPFRYFFCFTHYAASVL